MKFTNTDCCNFWMYFVMNWEVKEPFPSDLLELEDHVYLQAKQMYKQISATQTKITQETRK